MANLARYQSMPQPGLSLRDAIDRLFEDSWFYPRGTDQSPRSGFGHQAANLYEMEDAYLVQLAVPGIDPSQCELTVQQNVLTVRGQTSFQVPEPATPIWQGFGGTFEQSFTLPAAVEGDNVQASYECGILTLHLPKSEQARIKRIPIKAGRA